MAPINGAATTTAYETPEELVQLRKTLRLNLAKLRESKSLEDSGLIRLTKSFQDRINKELGG
jgi:hypothetical protein